MSSVRPSQVLDACRSEVQAIFSARSVRDVRIFGSVARGQDEPGSDIDLLGVFPEHFSLVDLMSLELDLEDLLGVEVDVVSDEGTTPVLNEARSEAVPL